MLTLSLPAGSEIDGWLRHDSLARLDQLDRDLIAAAQENKMAFGLDI